ncbi:RNA polymerase sigma-70 factor [Echinicola sediminis]
MDKATDEYLYQRVKQANHQAFDRLFDRYWKRLFQYAFRLLQDREQAEDVVQEVFIHFWENAQSKEIHHLSGYFFRAVKYQVANIIRNQKWTVEWEESQWEELLIEEKETENPPQQELQELLEKSIEKLPPRCREVFYLNKKEGFTAKEIAANLNISPRTVEHQLQKAMKSLKADLGQLYTLILILFYA